MRSKRFRTFLGCLFFFGLLVAALPILSFMTSPSIMDIRRERAAMATWPSVPGLLDEVRFQREWNRLRGRTWFYVEVSYRYTVNGQEYAGSGLGIQRMRDTSKEELANRMNRFVAVKNIMSREEGVKGYREPGSDQAEPRTVWRLRDQPATVYYDPQKPSISLLDTYDYDPPALIGELAPVLACFILGLTVMALSMRMWRDRRAAMPVGTGRPGQGPGHAVKDGSGSDHWYDCQQTAEGLMQKGRFVEALAAFDRTLDLNPWEAGTVYNGLKALLGKAECLIALGRHGEARRCLDEVLSSGRGLPSVEELRARARELKEANP